MNIVKGIFHTIRFMWIGRFGGVINGGNYYLLKTIRVHKNARFKISNTYLEKMHKGDLFIVDAKAVFKIINTTIL